MYKRTPISDMTVLENIGSSEHMGFFHDSKMLSLRDTKTFSVDTAWWMSELSRLSYLISTLNINKILYSIGFKNPKYFIDIPTGTFAFVVDINGMTIVVFRGTELTSFIDIKTDLNIFLTDENKDLNTRVHSGFKEGLDSIWDDLLMEIMKRNAGGQKLYFTGHSLGAALATLAASRIDECDQVYVFGSPRVGNSKFIKHINARIYRVSRARDIVTRIPPTFIGYRHIGDDYFITAAGKLIKNPSFIRKLKERLGGSELKILISMTILIFTRNPLSFIISYLAEHSPYNYSIFIWNNSSINQK